MRSLSVNNAEVTVGAVVTTGVAVTISGGVLRMRVDGRIDTYDVTDVVPDGRNSWTVTLTDGSVVRVRKGRGCGCR